MTFDHIRARVSGITAYTAEAASNTPADRATEGMDIAIHYGLASLCKKVRKLNPRVKFGAERDCTSNLTGATPVFNEVWAYIPGQPYAIMRIGYADYYSNSTEPRYGVHSRLITNNRFGDRHACYHTAITENLDRAVKTIKKYFRGYTTEEMCKVTCDTYGRDVRMNVSRYSTKINNAWEEVRGDFGLGSELVALVAAGYEFKHPALREKVVAYMEAKKERDAYGTQARHGWYVNVCERLGKQHFNVIELFELHQYRDPRMTPVVTYTDETLPEEIAGRLAVLMMAEGTNYIEDVGRRDTECTFYIDRPII